MSKRFIRVNNITYITPLQMDGPIVSPLAVSENTVRELVRKGYIVIEKIDGKDVVLTPVNVDNPRAYMKSDAVEEEAKPTAEERAQKIVHERVFTKHAPINTAPIPEPPKEETKKEAPKPVEKTVIEQEYDFGNDVEVVDTVIEPEPEIAGRLFTGRPMPDVSEDIESVAEVDTTTEGHVEDTKTVENNSNGGNRLQKKRKHKK